MSRAASKIYVPLDVAFFDDARIVAAGEKAAWLYLNMLTKAKALDCDGILTRQQIARLAVPGWQARLRALEAAGAVQLDQDEVTITGWLKWNEPASSRRERLEQQRQAKAEYRARRQAEEGGTE